jgi:hypothetical protein
MWEATQAKRQRRSTGTDDATCAANQSHQSTWILISKYSARSVTRIYLTALDCGYSPKDQTDKPTKKGLEKAGRDDEEEWGRIPIPQSDDESEGDTWLDESDGSDEKRNIRPACVVSVTTAFNNEPNIQVKERKVNWPTTDDLAFRHGSRRDGTILMKMGSS